MLWESVIAAQDVRRLHEIAKVLVQFGFADVVSRIGLAGALRKAGRRLHLQADETGARASSPERLRQALERLGPTFVKLGQILASRIDLFGPDWIAEFEKLQNHVPMVAFSVILSHLEDELGAPLAATLGTVDEEPLAAGSIAQVHRVRLLDGTEAVIKVRRPGVREIIQADVRLLEGLAGIIERRSSEAARYRPKDIVRHFRTSIERELDLAVECRNAERIASALGSMPRLVVPKVYWQWTSESINVQEFLPGRPLQELLEAGATGVTEADLGAIARVGGDAVLQMVFVDGFFHADPHGGNILYLPDGRIGLIDFGMVGHLSLSRRQQLVELLRSLAEHQAEHVAELLLEWADRDVDDMGAMVDEVQTFLDRYHGLPLAQIQLGAMLMEVAHVVRRHGVCLPPDLVMVVKVFITLEGLGRRLDPSFDMAASAKPFVRRIIRERYRPRALARSLGTAAVDVSGVLSSIPHHLTSILRRAGKGQYRLRIDVEQVPLLGERISHAANRLAMGLVIAALIIGSSIVMTVEGGPTIFGLPFFGLAGFIGAILLGAWLLLSILRSGGGR